MTKIKRAAARDARWHAGQARCPGSSPGLLRALAFPSVPGMGGHHPASGLRPAPLGAPTPWAGMANLPFSCSEDGAKARLRPFLPNPPTSGSPRWRRCPGDESPRTLRGLQGWHPPNRHRHGPHGIACPTSPATSSCPGTPWQGGEPLRRGGGAKSQPRGHGGPWASGILST